MATQEAALDTWAMQRTDPVKIIEVMGRNAGWLAAAAALGREDADDPPHLIFLPERPRSLDRMLQEIQQIHARVGWVVVVICENQRDDHGHPLGGGDPLYVDPHGHPYYETAGAALARLAQERLGIRTRYERPGSLQRSSASMLSEVDVDEAEGVGATAVDIRFASPPHPFPIAGEGTSAEAERFGAFPNKDSASLDLYTTQLTMVPLELIAHRERTLPDELIASSGTDVTPAFLIYARPLIGGPLPPFERFGPKGLA
jgi:6-phosphofructokinase 1